VAPDADAKTTVKRIGTRATCVPVGEKVQVVGSAHPGPGKAPAVIMLHGCDGWSQMWGYRFAAEGLVQTGHVAILIRYYDRTKTPDKVQPDQQKEFSRWL